METILVLGAGCVSGPCVDYLARKASCKVVVSDISMKNLAVIAERFPAVETVEEDISISAGRLFDHYQPAVVVNLMPPSLMFSVGEQCLARKIHQVHPAYLDQKTKSLSEACKKSGVTFITELGLDPGIDHMSAAKKIREIHNQGGKIVSYCSNCGALPAADSNTNPWGYKLSWSPSSLVGASKRTARLEKDGKEYFWPDGVAYENPGYYEVPGLGFFEIYANGDSIPYKALYGIQEAKNIYRGTIRYPGWCETISYMNSLGFFEEEKQDVRGLTFADFTLRQIGVPGKAKEVLCEALNLKPWSAFIMRMEWLGFFDEHFLPFEEASPRDIVSALFAEKLVYSEGERDLVVLCDEIKIITEDGKKQTHCATLIDFGTPGGWSSIARTTGIPPAIAARYILEGKITIPGVHIPTIPEIYEPVLEELAHEGIALKDKVVSE